MVSVGALNFGEQENSLGRPFNHIVNESSPVHKLLNLNVCALLSRLDDDARLGLAAVFDHLLEPQFDVGADSCKLRSQFCLNHIDYERHPHLVEAFLAEVAKAEEGILEAKVNSNYFGPLVACDSLPEEPLVIKVNLLAFLANNVPLI